jgi:hypothetical protein
MKRVPRSLALAVDLVGAGAVVVAVVVAAESEIAGNP